MQQHEWSMFSRKVDYGPDLALPLRSAKVVRKHLGVSKATISTPYTVERFASLQPSHGLLLYRDGRQEFSGSLAELGLDWDSGNGQAVIQASFVGDEQHLADRVSFPDPGRAADDQTVNDYWNTRDGAGSPVVVPASTAMMQLISDQAGPTCIVGRRVPGLVLGSESGVGTSRVWSALFSNVLDELGAISQASGANLGLRMTSRSGSITVDVVQPRDVAGAIRFSADLSNLAGLSYKLTAPKVTHGLAAGQGDLATRLRRLATTSDPDALAWGRQIWDYIDRRDTGDAADLDQAARDAVDSGGPTVSLSVTLREAEATTYGDRWGLGDRVTVYVGLPGQTKVATVVDVVREITLEVDSKGKETITPAIGSYDATNAPAPEVQKQLRAVRRGLAGLIARK